MYIFVCIYIYYLHINSYLGRTLKNKFVASFWYDEESCNSFNTQNNLTFYTQKKSSGHSSRTEAFETVDNNHSFKRLGHCANITDEQ